MVEINDFDCSEFSDNIVGRGGYSEVYRGDLSDGQTIAVKRLAKDNKDAKKEKEFLMELGIIGHVCHPNTASLVGCCIENGLHLIFNFSQNGNLASALHGEKGFCHSVLDFQYNLQYLYGIQRSFFFCYIETVEYKWDKIMLLKMKNNTWKHEKILYQW